MFLLGCLSSLLLYLTFPNIFYYYGIWPLAWFFAIPLFWALDNRGILYRLLVGTLYGVLFFLGFVSWLAPYNTLGFLAFVLALSVQPILFTLLFTSKIQNRMIEALYIPAAWVTSEFLHKVLCYGFSWTIGYSQSFNVYALQIADTLGSHGISFMIIFVNFCLYKIIRYRKHIVYYLFSITFALVIIFGYGFWTIHRKPDTSSKNYLKVALIQANISQEERTNPDSVINIIHKHIELTKESQRIYKPDLVIWPETAIPDDFLLHTKMKKKIVQLIKKTKTNYLIGAALLIDNKGTNSAVLMNKKGEDLDIYHKIHLVPFSEYIPSSSIMQSLAKTFKVKSLNFIPGEKLGFMAMPYNHFFGVSICSEDHYPNLFRKFAQKGAGFAVLLLNDGWFNDPEALIIHAQSSVLRSVENHLPLIRASNTGWSLWTDQYGRIDLNSTPPLHKRSSAIAIINPNTSGTFYGQFGDIFAAFCFLFVIIISVYLIIMSLRHKK